MTRTRWEPVEAQPERKSVAQRLWPIGIVADIAAVVTLVTGSRTILAVVVAAVALVLGVVHLAASLGKPVDRWVIVSVAGIVAGAVVITAVVTQSLHALTTQPTGQAISDSPPQSSSNPAEPTTPPPSTNSTPTTSPSTPIGSHPTSPAIKRETGTDPIVLTSGYSLDLDSEEPIWVAKKTGESSGHDLENSSGYVYAADDLAPAAADSTFEDCVRAGYVDYLSSSDLETGSAFCVKTTSGTYARVVVRDSQDYATQLTLDVVVWNKPS
ncbi:hypothetical protein SAMN02982929_04670 [Saccharopolyspora kobensis]|uniref:Uncharacterized protein n=1 Tax=Saccharopolyspora kobensis TaxID=146035 RepID=A0A1H6DPZ2_9PSEU|nr:hypothetical protein [Saccharopolyspora kobensis]SEG86726.1 hypothetical protein SAMN02982929_04670 [Saccharopolyspora kobensis]SFF00517.1 hypothetical protein SAMN05216506_11780 [Saccharopolyspora kobensis]